MKVLVMLMCDSMAKISGLEIGKALLSLLAREEFW